ncbi:MAG: SPFH domain-containing protein [Myxococcales bacterium]|nr:SPFH domain-containing protein [Myxococcales bacterium]
MLPEIPILLVVVVSGIAILALLGATFFTVEQRTAAVVQRLGKFMREAGPGIQLKIPLLDRVVGRVNLRVQQLDVEIETKTEDNVFVHMVVAVQYYVLPDKVYDAFYKLDDARRQITSFVFDVVRAQVPKIRLDDVFEKKDDIANIVKSELAQVMEDFGYGILKALVTDIDPDPKVKESMNEINAAQRMRVAATERGEADRILRVKAAEGDAQSKALQGRGIADQRQAIVAGLRDSVDEFRKSVPGTTAKDVMNLVLMTQYFDMLKEIGASSRTNAILIPHSPGNLTTLTEQMRNAMMEADQTVRASNAVPAIASMTLDNSRSMDGPRRESAPSSSGNSGRAETAIPKERRPA